ncbi:FAD-dependent oxidoreductase [Halovenus marina]|uniref:FAD-dependent oxidoreductase n=1 Tax=Halovenus marina TaxID=3396621 RepID=UPI003F5632EA
MTLESVPAYDSERISGVGNHAVVVGASISGLLAARVLADGFDKVTVVERDELPDEPKTRDGAPHARQPHLLQEAGRVIIEDLFPGYGDDLVSEGGLIIDIASDFNFYDEGGYVASPSTQIPGYAGSRPLLEHVIRKRVSEIDEVQLRDSTRVVGYRTDERGTTVTGAEISGTDDNNTSMSADLIVDATGRTSRTPKWLETRGYESPEVAEVNVDLAYSTTTVERDPDDQRAFWAPASPPYTRGGGALPIENERRQVVLHGVHGDDPPRNVDEFHDFASSLQITEVEEILDSHDMLSEDIDYYPFPSSRRRYYEELDCFPSGFLVVGDAIASYNPIYGQGMSVAALHALVLHHTLAENGLGNLGLEFFDEVEQIVDVAWMMAVGADFQFPETTGPKPRGTGLMGWYLSRLTRKAHTDRDLSERFIRVIMMEKPPKTLFRPGVVWRVLKPAI